MVSSFLSVQYGTLSAAPGVFIQMTAKLITFLVHGLEHGLLVLRQPALHGHDVGRVGAEVYGILQLQTADQPLLLVKQLTEGAFLEYTLLHILVQSASGLGVQRADEQQMELDRVDQG